MTHASRRVALHSELGSTSRHHMLWNRFRLVLLVFYKFNQDLLYKNITLDTQHKRPFSSATAAMPVTVHPASHGANQLVSFNSINDATELLKNSCRAEAVKLKNNHILRLLSASY